jgi:hypothetical protein
VLGPAVLLVVMATSGIAGGNSATSAESLTLSGSAMALWHYSLGTRAKPWGKHAAFQQVPLGPDCTLTFSVLLQLPLTRAGCSEQGRNHPECKGCASYL